MSKMIYQKPGAETIRFQNEDVITTSDLACDWLHRDEPSVSKREVGDDGLEYWWADTPNGGTGWRQACVFLPQN